MARRRDIGPGISFFAFQDIITAVVGIFILITLILVLELAQRVEAAGAGSPADAAPVVAAIGELEQELQRLRAAVDERAAVRTATAEWNAFNRADRIAQARAKIDSAEARILQLDGQRQRLEAELLAAASHSEQLRAAAERLQPQREAIEQLTEHAQKVWDRVELLSGDDAPLYRDQTEEGRFLVLLTLSGAEAELRDAATRRVQVMRGDDRLDRLRGWMRTTDWGNRQLLLLIEPGGAVEFAALRNDLEDSGVVYGYSVVGSNHAVRLKFEVDQQP